MTPNHPMSTPLTESRRRWWRELRRAASWHRRLLAAGLAAIAVAAGIQAIDPPEPVTVPVLVAARDLVAGVPLSAGDLEVRALPEALVPLGVLRPGDDAVGRLLTGAVRAGETLTDVRLLGSSLVDGLSAGAVATPVRVADASAAGLVRPGDRVDVLATPATLQAEASSTRVAASGVIVVAVPDPATPGGFGDGSLLVLATSPETAADLAAATVTSRLSIIVRGS